MDLVENMIWDFYVTYFVMQSVSGDTEAHQTNIARLISAI